VHALGVDFYAVPGQKWLCGPEGVGGLFVRRDRLPEVSQTYVGFASVQEVHGFDATGYFLPAPGARRFEVGTVYAPAIYGMLESLRYLEEAVGHAAISEATQAITRHCREALASVPGVTLLSPPTHAGLTAFSVDGHEPAEVVRMLAERRVIVRSIAHPGHVRVSTGFFNDTSDVERLVAGLEAIRGS
jgi:L-cysteine/cystine lyase